MARNATIVQVFVSSPSDLASERDILESLAKELNHIWSKSLGVIFELIRWETSVLPGISSDPQSVINDQIPNDYDVFIGLLWGRFGTPTPRALSGTKEEFDHAIIRRNLEGLSPEIMVYFKDAPIHPSKIDPCQLQLIQEFRASLSKNGVLYSSFEDESGFESSLRAHLSSLAQKFSTSKPILPKSPPPAGNEQQAAIDADELGFLDYLELYEARIEEMLSALDSISSATVRIGEQMTARSEEINSLEESQRDPKTARRLIKKGADDMISYATIVKQQLPLFASGRDAALNALTSALVLYEDFGDQDEAQLKGLRHTLSDLKEAAFGSKNGILGFRKSTAGLPRLTSELNRAKKAVLDQLDALTADIDKTISIVENILDSIDRMLKR